MLDTPEEIAAAENWLLSPAGRLAVAKAYLFELEQIEDYENCEKIKNLIVTLETEIENETKQ